MAVPKKKGKGEKSKKFRDKKKTKPKDMNEEEISDERFAAALTHPHFRKPKETETKVVLDERFASVLTDPRFSIQEKDKYGRKKKKGKKATAKDELSAFYTIEKGEQEEGEGKDDNDIPKDLSEKESDESDIDEQQEEDMENEESEDDPASRIAYLTALSRGELDISSSSSDNDDNDDGTDSSLDDSDSETESIHGKAGVLDPSSKEEDVPLTEVPSAYMAVLNLEWNNMRAVDLFMILSSFSPPGSVRRVQIFPSDFGMERMEQEKLHGPSDLWKEQEEDNDDIVEDGADEFRVEESRVDSGFDPEKLRAYEAAKLKYYFAVTEFASAEHADVCYREVDGLEFEHSSASIDMRSIDPDQLPGVVKGRTVCDEATSIPSNYEPPEFVVHALQQTNVNCTWEDGDMERDRTLTKYNNTGGENANSWQQLAESDDLRAYLASDNSSDDDDDDDDEEDSNDDNGGRKGSKMRQLLGLDVNGDDESVDDVIDNEGNESDNDDDNDEGLSKQVTFIPGKKSMEEKIRSKLQADDDKEPTPWEKYLQKKKEKRREKRRAARGKAELNEQLESGDHDDDDDDFFLSEGQKQKEQQEKSEKRLPSSKAELELLLAGDNEGGKEFDMRGLMRVQKNKEKKLKGARKRKESRIAAGVAGSEFRVNTGDNRFAAVLNGTDDRFGIDRTDPNFKDTEGMREILSEQSKRRKKRKTTVAPNVRADDPGTASSSGATALSSLVKSLKSKVENRSS